ncbi:hypothetical protein EG832_06735 [bacterium]|nr:hypothetical protein [bacterium]
MKCTAQRSLDHRVTAKEFRGSFWAGPRLSCRTGKIKSAIRYAMISGQRHVRCDACGSSPPSVKRRKPPNLPVILTTRRENPDGDSSIRLLQIRPAFFETADAVYNLGLVTAAMAGVTFPYSSFYSY